MKIENDASGTCSRLSRVDASTIEYAPECEPAITPDLVALSLLLL
jgi:hypothetical protein